MSAVGRIGAVGRLGLVAAAVRDVLADPRLEFFSNGEPGLWYDNSDLSTMFQDMAQTVPATVGSRVAFQLDKSGRGNHRFQATENDRPFLRVDEGGRYYLEANGTNTWMQTNAVDFTTTDKVTVFVGLRKIGTTAAIFAEFSASVTANAGSFFVAAPDSFVSISSYSFRSRGATAADPVTATGFAPPISSVVSGIGDISGDRATLRVGGNRVNQSTSDQGAGNYGNYPIFFYSRAGTSLRFNGRDYGILISGALHADPKIAAMERWLAPKTGVSL